MARFGAVKVGLTVRNATQPTYGEGAAAVRLDRQARAGISVTGPGRGGLASLTLAFDADLTRTPGVFGDERHVAGGLEAWLLGRRLGLRAGVNANTVGDTRTWVSGGASVALRQGFYFEGTVIGGGSDTPRGWGSDLRVTF
jgi:hypothetical protein